MGKTKKVNIARSLYWRIAAVFLLTMSCAGAIFMYIATDTAEMYFKEASQNMDRDLADHIASHTEPFVNGEINKAELDKTFENVMIYNSSTEVYLLDQSGTILSYYAPKSKVKAEKVDMEPIHQFLSDTTVQFILGTDPRHPEDQNVFSAAEVRQDGTLQGYIYVVLAGEEYTSVVDLLKGSYFVRLGGKGMLITLLASVVLGLVVLRLLTLNLNRIVAVVRRFREGDHDARIELQSKGELTQLAEDFNEMADTIVSHINEIKSVEQLRRELIANVSHDLRTPLAAIQGYAETLAIKRDSLTEEQKIKYTTIILQGTENVKKLVDDLFELSKLETKQIEAHFENFSLAELLTDVATKYALIAKKKGIQFDTTIPRDLPMIYADIALIDRVMQNLIDNALKYTSEGGRVAIQLNSNSKGMEVMVADTGLGIPEDQQPYIFDRYQQVGAPKEAGIGLGLAIVKKILELHQTDILVESKPNEGSRFTFLLPTVAPSFS